MAGTGKAHLRAPGQSLLRVEDLVVEFPAGRGQKVHAVTDVNLDVMAAPTSQGWSRPSFARFVPASR